MNVILATVYLVLLFWVENSSTARCFPSLLRLEGDQLEIACGRSNTREWKNICIDSVRIQEIADLACFYQESYEGRRILSGSIEDCIMITCGDSDDLWECDTQRTLRNTTRVICGTSESTVGVIIPETTMPATSRQQPTTDVHSGSMKVNSGITDVHSGSMKANSGVSVTNNESIVSRLNTTDSNVLGGALGTVIGILIIVAVVLFLGSLYYRNKANSYRMTVEEGKDSHIDNPVYGAPASASLNHQQHAQQVIGNSETNANHYQVEDDPDYHVLEDRDYHVLEDPSQSEDINQVSGQHSIAVNYEGFREDSVSVQSYEVPVNQKQEKRNNECQDYSMIDEAVKS